MDTKNSEQLSELVKLVLDAKPYLRYIEENIKITDYGEIHFTFTVRAGVIEKIQSQAEPTVWLRQKQLDPKA